MSQQVDENRALIVLVGHGGVKVDVGRRCSGVERDCAAQCDIADIGANEYIGTQRSDQRISPAPTIEKVGAIIANQRVGEAGSNDILDAEIGIALRGVPVAPPQCEADIY